MNKEELEDCLGEEFTFTVRQIVNDSIIDKELMMDSKRLKTYSWLDIIMRPHIRSILTLATQEEEVFDYPADWFQWFKQRWFPKWLLAHYPIRTARIWAISKFPELNIPNEFVGKEFVHFRVVNEDKLRKKIEKEEKE